MGICYIWKFAIVMGEVWVDVKYGYIRVLSRLMVGGLKGLFMGVWEIFFFYRLNIVILLGF